MLNWLKCENIFPVTISPSTCSLNILVCNLWFWLFLVSQHYKNNDMWIWLVFEVSMRGFGYDTILFDQTWPGGLGIKGTSLCWNPLADLQEGALGVCPHWPKLFSILCSFQKIWQNRTLTPLLEGWRPFYRNPGSAPGIGLVSIVYFHIHKIF